MTSPSQPTSPSVDARVDEERRVVASREGWYLLAYELEQSRYAYLNGMGEQGNAERKAKLEQLLWDDKCGIIEALKVAALSAPRAPDTSPLVDGETNLEDCKVCGGSGFSGRGTGYDDVCAECGGLKSLPAQRKNIVAPKLSEQIARDIRLGTFPKKSKETESEDYIVSLRTHVGEGGQLSHQNGLWLLNEVERLQGLLPVFIGGTRGKP